VVRVASTVVAKYVEDLMGKVDSLASGYVRAELLAHPNVCKWMPNEGERDL
jgi:hypothetical protein